LVKVPRRGLFGDMAAYYAAISPTTYFNRLF